MTDYCASVVDLSFAYDQGGVPALRNISFNLSKGEVLAVIGPPQSGKTTLGLALSGALRCFFPASQWTGRASVAGVEVKPETFDQLILRAGMLFENPGVQISGTKPTVFEEIAGVLQNIGVARVELRDRVSAVLDQLGVRHLSSRSPVELSGGETQKVALATVLVKNPELVILDQPFSQLDLAGVAHLSRIVQALAKQSKGVVILESDASYCELAETELRLDKGRMIGYGALRDISPWSEAALLAGRRANTEFHGSTKYRDCLRFLYRLRNQHP